MVDLTAPDHLDPTIVAAFRASEPRISRRLSARRTSTWLLAGGAMAVLTACGAGNAASQEDIAALRKEIAAIKGGAADPHADPKAAADGHGTAAAGAHDTKHWTYEGETGPEQWAQLAPENAVCSAGSNQSPIDIKATQPGAGGRTNIKWAPSALDVVNNGHTIQADVTAGGGIEVDGVASTRPPSTR